MARPVLSSLPLSTPLPSLPRPQHSHSLLPTPQVISLPKKMVQTLFREIQLQSDLGEGHNNIIRTEVSRPAVRCSLQADLR